MLSKIKLQEEHHYFLVVLLVAVVGGLVLSGLDSTTDLSSITGSTALITGRASHPIANTGAPTIAQCLKGPVEQCMSCCASSQEIQQRLLDKKTLKEKKLSQTGSKAQARLAKKNLAKEMRKCAYACKTTIRDSFVQLYSGKPAVRWHWPGTTHSQRNYYYTFDTKENPEAGNNIWDYEGYSMIFLEQQLPGTIPVYLFPGGGNNQPGDLKRFITDTKYKEALIKEGYAHSVIGYIAPPTIPKEKASELFGGRPVKRLFQSRHEDRGRGVWFYLYTTNEGENSATKPGSGSGWVREKTEGLEDGFVGYIPDAPIPWRKHIIPGVIEAEEYDFGGQGVAFNDVSEGNAGGFTFRIQESEHDGTKWIKTQGVDIYELTGGYGVGWVEQNEWLLYTVNIEQDGLYDIETYIARDKQGDAVDAMKIEMAPNGLSPQYELKAVFNAKNTGSMSTPAPRKQKGKLIEGDTPIELKKGQYLMKITILSNELYAFGIDKIAFIKK